MEVGDPLACVFMVTESEMHGKSHTDGNMRINHLMMSKRAGHYCTSTHTHLVSQCRLWPVCVALHIRKGVGLRGAQRLRQLHAQRS